jgi:aminoglycoside phosphotransferase (APT) family kinase protein
VAVTRETPGVEAVAAVAAVAARYGVAAGQVRPVPEQGVAAEVWLLGDDLVLKAARDGFAADLRKEAVVIPHARALGVRTPELVAAGDLDGVPYLVLRRATGLPGLPAGEAYRALGRELARLHAGPVPAAVRRAVPEDPPDDDPAPAVERLAASGHLSAELAGWVAGRLGALAARAAWDGVPPVLLHGDVAAGNVLTEPRAAAAVTLLDWGDAAIGDPAAEFAKVPPRHLPDVLTGYLPRGAADPAAPRWVARALWHHLTWAVLRLPTGPEPGAAHWSAQPGNRLLELLRAYSGALPEPWAGWMRSA